MRHINKIPFLLLVIIGILIVPGCVEKTEQLEIKDGDLTKESTKKMYTENGNEVDIEKPHGKDALTFEEYQQLFMDMSKELELKGLELKKATTGKDVKIVEKEATFGKRKYLTLDGTLDMSNVRSTQESLIYEDRESTKHLSITIAYSKYMNGNDLLMWPSIRKYEGVNDNLVEHVDTATLAYKNVIIFILQSTDGSEKADTVLTHDVITSLIDYLNEKE
ncbi:hypothetical protein [Pontibacillus salipaludis]|uniref:hypothetical protein n=1 Tax=Pontibacillus salipaludis TaxID=1697394 RepID=UPI0031E98BB7